MLSFTMCCGYSAVTADDMSIVVQLEERNSKLELQFRRQMPVFNPKKLKLDEWRKEQARLTQADQRIQEINAALEVRISGCRHFSAYAHMRRGFHSALPRVSSRVTVSLHEDPISSMTSYSAFVPRPLSQNTISY